MHVREEVEACKQQQDDVQSLTSPVAVLTESCQVQSGHVLAARLLAIRVRTPAAADPPRVTSDGRLLDLHPERLHNHERKERSAQLR